MAVSGGQRENITSTLLALQTVYQSDEGRGKQDQNLVNNTPDGIQVLTHFQISFRIPKSSKISRSNPRLFEFL